MICLYEQCCSWKINLGGTVEITNRYLKVNSIWKYIFESIFTGTVKVSFYLDWYGILARTGLTTALSRGMSGSPGDVSK